MKLPRVLKMLFPVFIFTSMLILPLSAIEANAKTSLTKTERAAAYITSFKYVKGNLVGSFDYIEWYTSRAADREFLKDCKCSADMSHAPDGYYIRNANKKIRTYPISGSAQFILQTKNPYKIKWNEKVTKAQFLTFLNQRNKDCFIPFHLEITNGIVTKITEQYIP